MLGITEAVEEVVEPNYEHIAGTDSTVDLSALELFSTGCVTLDLGFGGLDDKRSLGLAYGGWVTLCGPSGHGKTTFGCEIVASAKRWAEEKLHQNVIAHVVDLEKTGFNISFAEKTLGKQLGFGVEKNVDNNFSAFHQYVKSFITECQRVGKKGVLLIDSISMVMGDREYLADDPSAGSYGLEAYRQFDLYSPKLVHMCANAGVTLIFITHTKLDMNQYSARDFGEKMPKKLGYLRNHGIMLDKKIPLRNKNKDTTGFIAKAIFTKTRTGRQDLMIPLVERTYYGIDERASCIAWLVLQKPYGGHDALMNLFANGGQYPLGFNVKASISKDGADAIYAGQEIWDNLTMREVSNPGDESLLEMHKALRRETIRIWMEKEERIAQENGVGLKHLIPLSLDQDY